MAVRDAVAEDRARQAVELLSGRCKVVRAYLFGSSLAGARDEHSDIDIAVFVEGYEGWDFKETVAAMYYVEKIAGFDIELHFFDSQLLTRADPASFAAYVIKTGRAIELEIPARRR